MAMWTSRTSGYKLGVLVLFLGAAFYLIGYASPFWFSFSSAYSYSGLWLSCVKLRFGYSSGVECGSMIRSAVGWFKAVQALESVGLIGVFISCAYAFVVNCCKAIASHNRVLEILTGLSGIIGFIACMVFVGKTEKNMSQYYGWAFGLNLTGCILLIIAAVVIFITNRADLAQPATGGGVIYAGDVPAQGGGVVVMQQGQGYPPPPQGYPSPAPQGYPQGAGYPAQAGYGYPQGYAGPAQYPGGYPPAPAPAQAGYNPAGYSASSYNQGYSATSYNQGYSGQAETK